MFFLFQQSGSSIVIEEPKVKKFEPVKPAIKTPPSESEFIIKKNLEGNSPKKAIHIPVSEMDKSEIWKSVVTKTAGKGGFFPGLTKLEMEDIWCLNDNTLRVGDSVIKADEIELQKIRLVLLESKPGDGLQKEIREATTLRDIVSIVNQHKELQEVFLNWVQRQIADQQNREQKNKVMTVSTGTTDRMGKQREDIGNENKREKAESEAIAEKYSPLNRKDKKDPGSADTGNTA